MVITESLTQQMLKNQLDLLETLKFSGSNVCNFYGLSELPEKPGRSGILETVRGVSVTQCTLIELYYSKSNF